jgi:hypothetical protein
VITVHSGSDAFGSKLPFCFVRSAEALPRLGDVTEDVSLSDLPCAGWVQRWLFVEHYMTMSDRCPERYRPDIAGDHKAKKPICLADVKHCCEAPGLDDLVVGVFVDAKFPVFVEIATPGEVDEHSIEEVRAFSLKLVVVDTDA